MSLRRHAPTLFILLSLAACELGDSTNNGEIGNSTNNGTNKPQLTATERSATTLKLLWPAMGTATQYT
ncbi:MAG TPA: hypothetical protein VM100_07330, partial [Longimicrobiales bacterium]|nr:hypothetical protein [Longimicrobiales bacterium]